MLKSNTIDLAIINNINNKIDYDIYNSLKPGAYLFSIDKPNKAHNTVCDLEDIGFLIKDSISYFFKENEDVKQYTICLAMKPLSEKNFAENVMKWGTGGLNIDACRIGNEKISVHNAPKGTFAGGEPERGSETIYREHEGRYPANFIISEDIVPVLDGQSKGASRFFKNVDSHKDLLKYITVMGLPPKQGKVLFLGFDNTDEVLKEINNENGTSYEVVGGIE